MVKELVLGCICYMSQSEMMGASELDDSASIFDLGITSMSSVRFRNLLEELLEVELESDILYRHFEVGALCAELERRVPITSFAVEDDSQLLLHRQVDEEYMQLVFTEGGGNAPNVSMSEHDLEKQQHSTYPDESSVKLAYPPLGNGASLPIPAHFLPSKLHFACFALAQLVGLFVLATVYLLGCVLMPFYIISRWLNSNIVSSYLLALVCFTVFIVLFFVNMAVLCVVLKWALVWRLQPGRYPQFCVYHYRWWLFQSSLHLAMSFLMPIFGDSPLITWFYFALGARIGAGAKVETLFCEPDLVVIGEGAQLDASSQICTHFFEPGFLRLDRVVVGKRVLIDRKAIVGIGSVVGDGCEVMCMTPITNDSALPPLTRWMGSPANLVGVCSYKCENQISTDWYAWLSLCVKTMSLLAVALVSIMPTAALADIVVADAFGDYAGLVKGALGIAIQQLTFCLLTVGLKWVLLGRLRHGYTFPARGCLDLSRNVVDKLGILCLTGPVGFCWNSIVTRSWFRMLGAKIGTEGVLNTWFSPSDCDLLNVGDCVVIGGGSTFSFCMDVKAAEANVASVRMKRMTQVTIPSFSVIGHKSHVGEDVSLHEYSYVAPLTWLPAGYHTVNTKQRIFGIPAVIPHNKARVLQSLAPITFGDAPKPILGGYAYVFQLLLFALLAVLLFLFMLPGYRLLYNYINVRVEFCLWILPFWYMSVTMLAMLLFIFLKWILIGVFCEGVFCDDSFSLRYWFLSAVGLLTLSLSQKHALQGTPLYTLFLKVVGCDVHYSSCIDSLWVYEFDLVHVEALACINQMSSLVPHDVTTDETTLAVVTRLSHIYIRKAATVGLNCAIHGNVDAGACSFLDHGSRPTVGETIETMTIWGGTPAKKITSKDVTLSKRLTYLSIFALFLLRVNAWKSPTLLECGSAIQRSAPFIRCPEAVLRSVRVIFTDFDGTVTDPNGALPSSAIDMLWRCYDANISLVLVTGRSVEWARILISWFPFSAGICENGGAILYRDHKVYSASTVYDPDVMTSISDAAISYMQTPVHTYYVIADPHARAKCMGDLHRFYEKIQSKYTNLALAQDQSGRHTDLAIDFAEDPAQREKQVSKCTLEQIATEAALHNLTARISSIHLNVWNGPHNKAVAIRHLITSLWREDCDTMLEHALCLGDSPNDAPMFELIPLSVGMANLVRYSIQDMSHSPSYVVSKNGGDGFAMALQQVLNTRRNTSKGRIQVNAIGDKGSLGSSQRFGSDTVVARSSTVATTTLTSPSRITAYTHDFAVVIPCFNDASALSRTLAAVSAAASFAHQTKSLRVHVLLLDNNSSHEDLTPVYRKYLPQLQVTLVLREKLDHTYALCSARNLGIRMAQAPYVVTLDSDCMVGISYFINLRHLLDAYGGLPVLLAGERVFVDGSNVSEERLLQQQVDGAYLRGLPRVASNSNYGEVRDRRFPGLETVAKQPHPWSMMHGGNLVFHSADAVRCGGFDERFDGHWGYEDVDFAYRMINISKCSPCFARGCEVYHQERAGDSADKVEKCEEDRWNKSKNANWQQICATIPGYEEFKTIQYKQLSGRIVFNDKGGKGSLGVGTLR